jgi:hypothetical protein
MKKGKWNPDYTRMSVNGILFRDSNLPVHGEMSTGGELLFRRSEGKVKVKVTLVHALRLCTGRTAHSGSRGIALLFHDHGTRRG